MKIEMRKLEFDVIATCNLSCRECSHFSPLLDSSYDYPLEWFERDVSILSRFLEPVTVKIVGGEPLLKEDLSLYIDILKKYRLGKKVELATNGILLTRTSIDLLRRVDILSISIYRELSTVQLNFIERLRKICPQIDIYDFKSFKTFLYTGKNNDPVLVKQIWDTCPIKYECYSFYRGYFLRCMNSMRKYQLLNKYNISNDLDPVTFGCDLYQPNLEKHIFEYFFNLKPLACCSYCTGWMGKSVPCSQQSYVNIHSDEYKDIKKLI